MIFISYRTSDSLDMASRLDTDLSREFGHRNVFRDRTRLIAGKLWDTQLEQNAKDSKVMLVVIGPTWQSATIEEGDLQGLPRLYDDGDWVRREITLALDAGNVLLPLFLTGAGMPAKRWLKGCTLDRLSTIQGLQLRSADYDTDFANLVGKLRQYGLDPTTRLSVEPIVSPPSPPQVAKVWQPKVVHALQPAPHFAGREEVLKDLSEWARAPHDPNRVVALVAAGGTGKTAVAERVLTSLSGYTTAGVFVWSFYEEPDTKSFLRAACLHFVGETPNETGGLLEPLQQFLRTHNLPHLFILDGLELVQATGTTGRPRGELEDPLLKRFLRWLASSLNTQAKALITSRFALPDLEAWKDHGFRLIDLADLDMPAARAILRRLEVKGTDAALDALAGSVQKHALTVDVLGSYLKTFHGGDPTRAPSFDPRFLADTDPKTARLHRVLTFYAEKLQPRERDLLARLSVFPRGVGVDVIDHLITAGGEVAGSLHKCESIEVRKLLESLRVLGLVFQYSAGGVTTFTAHPFLREFFQTLLEVKKRQRVHEVVRAKLVTGLTERPGKRPTDPVELDRYEQLIEVTRLAGKEQKAFDLFRHGLGGYHHLGSVLGDNARGLRILAGFSKDGTPATVTHRLPPHPRAVLVSAWGLFARILGDLATARQALQIGNENDIETSNNNGIGISLYNIAECESVAGKWPEARKAAQTAVHHIEKTSDDVERRDMYACLAMTMAGLGFLVAARHYFSEARKREDKASLYSLRGVWEAELLLATGHREAAHSQTGANRLICLERNWTQPLALCDTLLGHCMLPRAPTIATAHLTAARDSASRTGDVEATLRCYLLAAVIARYEKKIDLAISEALDGIQLADSYGFGRWSLDIRTELAKIYLVKGQRANSIEAAEWVLKRSEEPDCQYAWGVADSLHLLGVAHAQMKRKANKTKARDFLGRAVEKRRTIEHGELMESENLLQNLGP